MDWDKIKTEYITDESTSYRKLADKYGVSYTSIGARARQEGWAEERERFRTKTLTKTLNAIGNERAKEAARVQAIGGKLLDKIENAVDDFDMRVLFTDRSALKSLTGALKDLKDIMTVKTEDGAEDIVVRIEGDAEDLSR